MRGNLWSCLLGLLFMPIEAKSPPGTAFQNPSSISYVRVNSSAEITCSTNLARPLSLELRRHFPDHTVVVYLALSKTGITKNTTVPEFKDRLHITSAQHIKHNHSLTWRLSLLGVEDTNLYYCRWTYIVNDTGEVRSIGTVIVVTENDPLSENDPQAQCRDYILDLVLIGLCVTAVVIIIFLSVAALIQRCKQFNKDFRPARDPPESARGRRSSRVHPCEYDVLDAPYSDMRTLRTQSNA
ncbi:uncharacterized protein LOC125022138 [Mugil cephalus]|uniref:uncharacterized protein LOC125022138 n=1 Tax=Mugil cephalus TaxID=48193 RepID=UPI001FB7E39F|nr:uncharacterized protein LOC125022138 [Mugil cephalus]